MKKTFTFDYFFLSFLGSRATRARWLVMTSTCLSSSARRGSHMCWRLFHLHRPAAPRVLTCEEPTINHTHTHTPNLHRIYTPEPRVLLHHSRKEFIYLFIYIHNFYILNNSMFDHLDLISHYSQIVHYFCIAEIITQ